MSPLRATLGVIALLMAVAPAGASARQADPILHNKRLWATVNVCDTVGHPDSIGIRGSMPGSGDKAEVMFMRFQVQVFDQDDAHWHNLAGADSGFVAAGLGRSKARQSGNTFTITPPRAGRRAVPPARGGHLRMARGRRGRAPRAQEHDGGASQHRRLRPCRLLGGDLLDHLKSARQQPMNES